MVRSQCDKEMGQFIVQQVVYSPRYESIYFQCLFFLWYRKVMSFIILRVFQTPKQDIASSLPTGSRREGGVREAGTWQTRRDLYGAVRSNTRTKR
ncbi:hypothetical protein RRG08_043472 [Elysia crispata]|uniref:Uncharacterized protein n=1 Tax=Elysia crispata TaxID=231223 RepID=A0AAE0YFS9_9GAST|nr:hypothetical protein RRG08_043472 [Elysia crispata]